MLFAMLRLRRPRRRLPTLCICLVQCRPNLQLFVGRYGIAIQLWDVGRGRGPLGLARDRAGLGVGLAFLCAAAAARALRAM